MEVITRAFSLKKAVELPRPSGIRFIPGLLILICILGTNQPGLSQETSKRNSHLDSGATDLDKDAEDTNTLLRADRTKTLRGIKAIVFEQELIPVNHRKRLIERLKKCGAAVYTSEIETSFKDAIESGCKPDELARLNIQVDTPKLQMIELLESLAGGPKLSGIFARLELSQKCVVARTGDVVATQTYALIEPGIRSNNIAQKLDRLIDTFVIDFLTANSGGK